MTVIENRNRAKPAILRHSAVALVLLAACLMPPTGSFGQTPAPSTVQQPTAAPAAPPAAMPAPAAPVTSVAPAMPATPVPAVTPPAVTLPRDLSPWGMFMAADIVVKAVMIGLAFASVLTWTVWLAKLLELMMASGKLRRGIRTIDNVRS